MGFNTVNPFNGPFNGQQTKPWIKGSLANFIWETKPVSKQDVLIKVTCLSKVVQWTETMLSKLATFPYIHWVEKAKKPAG